VLFAAGVASDGMGWVGFMRSGFRPWRAGVARYQERNRPERAEPWAETWWPGSHPGGTPPTRRAAPGWVPPRSR